MNKKSFLSVAGKGSIKCVASPGKTKSWTNKFSEESLKLTTNWESSDWKKPGRDSLNSYHEIIRIALTVSTARLLPGAT
jgi:hypothetical protein